MEARDLSAGGIMISGFVLVVLQLFQGVQQLEGFDGTDLYIVFIFETIPFVLVGLALMYIGSWLLTQADLDDEIERVVAWAVGSSILFSSIAALLIFSLEVTLSSAANVLEQAPFIVVNLLTVGALAGTLVGIYDARRRIHQRELEHERDRVEQFANKAADINNYGRELNRSDSVEEVSSLCLQATETFLGLTNLAFAVMDTEETVLVDDTTVGVPESVLFDLATDSLEQQPATAVSHDLPAGNERRSDGALTLLITNTDDETIVLIALDDDSVSISEENLKLLEMLVAHAGTAVDRLYEKKLQAEETES
ncbi:hypothetical protein ACFQJ7_04270 [Halovenus rubra]|uniref:Archaeal histidine kinase 4TM domain-containing protein n=2 Tax=Halovenus rubra TaxID=869890 RepID=A0ABD5X2D9_9EURY|nr:hypothetical protein [Halovenus rubra]